MRSLWKLLWQTAGVDFTLAKKQRKTTSWIFVPFFMGNHADHLKFYTKTRKKAPIFVKNFKIDARGLRLLWQSGFYFGN